MKTGLINWHMPAGVFLVHNMKQNLSLLFVSLVLSHADLSKKCPLRALQSPPLCTPDVKVGHGMSRVTDQRGVKTQRKQH